MRFGILGPLRVGGSETAVTAGRDRTVLAVLLLHAGRVVPVDELIDAVWGVDPPATARGQLQTCVSRLRRSIAEAGVTGERIVTGPAGYRVEVGPDELDVQVFDRLVAAARLAATDHRWAETRETYRSALALWRGPALPGFDSEVIRRAAAFLGEQRITVLEECVEVELRLGMANDLVVELTDLVVAYPLRERSRAQLMRALHQAGRPAEALGVYREGWRLLSDELGLEPGRQLRELHQQILTDEVVPPGAPATPLTTLATVRPRPPVHHLPRAVGDFTGHEETVRRLLAAAGHGDGAGERGQDRAATAPYVVDGMAGSGKTTFVVHVASLLRPYYPDAQLFVDLHGDSDRTPVEPAAALVTLLRQLGVPAAAIPADLDDRIRLWHDELATRRTVLVLDNASGTDQVSPLLPATANCLTLITSRRRLLGLDGIRPEPLRLFTTAEGVELLSRVAGDRVRDEPEAAEAVVRRCGHLPLAIRLAGARLAHRPSWRVADLAERLRPDRSALAQLAAEHRSVQSAFALSYTHLPAPAQRMFRLLGLHPGESFDGYAAAALTGLPLAEATDLLDRLVDWHLVEEPAAGRFRFHDLVREYAASLAAAGPAEERAEAAIGLLDHYLHLGAVATGPQEAADGLHAFRFAQPRRPDLLAPPTVGLRRLEAERQNVVAAVRFAESIGEDRYVWSIARAAWRLFYVGGYHDDLVETHTRGLAAAQRLADQPAATAMRNYLASGYFRMGRHQEAVDQLLAALEQYERDGDLPGQARVRLNLSLPYVHLNQPETALAHCAAGLRLRRRIGDLTGISHALSAITDANLKLGRYRAALYWGRRHVTLARRADQGFTFDTALVNLGVVRARLGHHRPAYRLLVAALALSRRNGNRYGEAEGRHGLGLVLAGLGRPAEALAMHQAALAFVQDIGDRARLVELYNSLGSTLLLLGDVPGATRMHERVLADPIVARYPLERARALDGLASCLVDDDPATARRYWEQALVTYDDLELAEAAVVRRRLAELDEPVPAIRR
ncbi:BTAD domain-containing putative transcriptional regulator [Plantactinospora sp. B5E13]|uniref:AfsR/SARP family transcriptional regulator n=1 Tax=Plantactinospora sp. B5E13 TaxID=3153758 RepID=UPI00325D484B